MSDLDFNDDFYADDVADAIDDARKEAREDAYVDPKERFGIGVCVTGNCVEPCGMDGGCSR
jgi:hypothetical protein